MVGPASISKHTARAVIPMTQAVVIKIIIIMIIIIISGTLKMNAMDNIHHIGDSYCEASRSKSIFTWVGSIVHLKGHWTSITSIFLNLIL